jgi:ribosomal protein L37AE/L43A
MEEKYQCPKCNSTNLDTIKGSPICVCNDCKYEFPALEAIIKNKNESKQ